MSGSRKSYAAALVGEADRGARGVTRWREGKGGERAMEGQSVVGIPQWSKGGKETQALPSASSLFGEHIYE